MIPLLVLLAFHCHTSMANCNDISLVSYTIFNNRNYNGKPLRPDTVVPHKNVYILIHGWRDSANQTWITTVRNILRMIISRSNIIMVDYSAYALHNDYENSICKTPLIGNALAEALLNAGVNTAITRCIGMSLGAHICGACGRRIIEQNNPKLRRITALDAAGPGYDPLNMLPTRLPWMPQQQYVKSGDAQEVVGIYSDGSGFGLGMKTVYADYNIFINGGESQPCLFIPHCIAVNLLAPFSCLSCQHYFATAMYVRHLQGVKYVLKKCNNYEDFSMGQCFSNPSFIYSEEFPYGAPRGNYYLKLDEDSKQIG